VSIRKRLKYLGYSEKTLVNSLATASSVGHFSKYMAKVRWVGAPFGRKSPLFMQAAVTGSISGSGLRGLKITPMAIQQTTVCKTKNIVYPKNPMYHKTKGTTKAPRNTFLPRAVNIRRVRRNAGAFFYSPVTLQKGDQSENWYLASGPIT
jgi:hypothetical protein